MRIGVASVGYADGYPRHLHHRHAGAGERRSASAWSGASAWDMITVDLTPVPDAGFGSDVTLCEVRASMARCCPID